MASLRSSIFIFLFLSLFSGCSEPLYKQQTYIFDSWAEINIYGENDQKAQTVITEIIHEFDRLQHMMHSWKPSELSRLNTVFSNRQSANISAELVHIIQDATRLSEQSGGRFNPATGKLIGLWGFHADEIKPAMPSPAVINNLIQAKPRMTDIFINGTTVGTSNSAVQLDLDDYAKGYALDRTIEILKRHNIKNALVNIGGNIAALGEKGNYPWKIGIQHPRKSGPIAMLELSMGERITIIGDYQHYFELDGKRYCNVINPLTGYPIQNVQAVATVTKQNEYQSAFSMMATKSLLVADVNKWYTIAQQQGTSQAFLIDANGEVYIGKLLSHRMEFRLPKPIVHEIQ